MEGMQTAAQEAERTEGEEDMDGTETATGNLSIGEDNIAHLTLGTDTNAPLAYDLGLELHHLIISKLGDHRGQ